MSRKLWSSLFVLVIVGLLAGCVVPAAPALPTQAPAVVEPTVAPATEVTPATEAAAERDPARLILATTTSTADSGLLDAILPDFEAKTGAQVDVVAVGTGQALEIGSKGDADVVLVHSRAAEDKFVADGHAKERFDVMYNDYVIVGPKDDPAKIAGMPTGAEAFTAIKDAEATFASRGDDSGTHKKEVSIWASIPFEPSADMPWYNSLGQGMGDTLLFANEQNAYTLADRGTYLSMQDKLPNLSILVGGESLDQNADKSLLNPYGVLAVNPEMHPMVNAALADQFVKWIVSVDTQKMIGDYGVDTYGQPLFYPDSAEYRAYVASTQPATASAGGKLILATTTSTADSGLLDFILPDFEAKTGATVDVVAVGTGQALEIGSKGDADVVLVHSRKSEDQFVADGHARERFDVMYNDFIVVGPKDDPAKVAETTAAKAAFQAIMDSEAPFVSRGDKSGTNNKELSIWASIPVTPTAEMAWYNSIGQGMGDTLLFANEQGGYTLSDRGTYLSMQDKLPGLAIVLGGDTLEDNKDKSLLNPYGVMAVNPEAHPGVNAALAEQFVDWIVSLDTQKMIGGYGVEEFGQPLFYASSDETKATDAVTVKNGETVKTLTLDELKALPAVTLAGYEATGHKKGPLGANDWTGAALKDVLLAADPTIGDAANDGKFIVIRASDGWRSVIRWNQIFGEPKGGEVLADSYGCTECHGYAGEGVEGSRGAPALAGKGWTGTTLGALMRAGHGGIRPYTPEQLPDADLAEIALWLEDPTADPPADAYVVPTDQMVTLLAYQRNGEEMNGRDGLIQLIMAMDKYTSRYAHWVKTIELTDTLQ